MINFTASLKLWTSADGRSHFVTVPACVSDEIKAHALANPRGFGSVKVSVTIDDVTWPTSLFPSKGTGGYFLPIRIDVCRKIGIVEGNRVEIGLELL